MNTKTIKQWVSEILGKHEEDLRTLPSPSEETVKSLIERGGEQVDSEDVGTQRAALKENNEKGCSYAMRRNIVESLQEIRRFAEEHHLASTMVKALLTLLAEMAINALKGKVSGAVMAVLLNSMNFEKARSEAYKEGEIAGRNAQIMERHFPKTDDGLPHLHGSTTPGKDPGSIFSIAREA